MCGYEACVCVCVSCVDEYNLLCFEECNVVEVAAVAAVADVAATALAGLSVCVF